MEQATQEEIKAKIAQLRKRYEILRAMAGPRGLNLETIKDYANEIEKLQAKLLN